MAEPERREYTLIGTHGPQEWDNAVRFLANSGFSLELKQVGEALINGNSSAAPIPNDAVCAPEVSEQAVDDDSLASALSRVGMFQALVRASMEGLNATAVEARTLGATWVQLGEAAGIRPNGAQQRWSKRSRELHREAQRRYEEKHDN